MPSISELLERESTTVDLEPGDFERLVRRRDRKRRDRRISAGVVGVAVFVAAIWIVTSGSSLDRKKSVAPAGEVTGPAETASPEHNVTRHRCSAGARSRLELSHRPIDLRIEVRFEVYDSPPGYLWHIRMWRSRVMDPGRRVEMWRGATVASDRGDFAVVRLPSSDPDNTDGFIFEVKAIDSATGQVCEVIDRA